MLGLQRALLMVAAASAVVIPTVRQDFTPRVQPRVERAPYTTDQVEYYLTQEQASWIRPGFNVEVLSADVDADRHPVVEFCITDDLGQPLDRAGVETPGAISLSWIIARWNEETRVYYDYVQRTVTSPITGVTANQATAENNGTYVALGQGCYQYTFSTQLPSGYPADMTHTIGMYGTRNLNDIDPVNKTYVENVEYDFVPNGSPVEETWAAFTNDDCNSCHDPLAVHGGSRQDVKLCVLCHNEGQIDPDTGESIDMQVMIHKIHHGANLPSVQAGEPYVIIGFRQTPHDYSDVHFPAGILRCTVCHDPSNPEGHVWYTEPSIPACGSCHDDIDFDSGLNHPAGPAAPGTCENCHVPTSGHEFDASIIGAHTIAEESEQVEGLNLEFISVENTLPGECPTITFTLFDDAGNPVDPTTLNSFNFLVGGPTAEYTRYFRESLDAANLTGSDGTYMYTLQSACIPEDATGSWAFSADAYRFVDVDTGDETVRVRDAAFNPIFYAPVTDAVAVERREVVSLDKCNDCHGVLALHGGQRFRIEECVICHNPLETDEARRPEDAGEPESVHLKWLIHRLHTGADLESDFTVYGFGGQPHNYNDLHYPGDLANCEKCHVNDSHQLPVPDEALPTFRPRDPFFNAHPYTEAGMIPPETAACISCHDNEVSIAHAWVNIAPFQEACTSCHGPASDFSVERVHAR